MKRTRKQNIDDKNSSATRELNAEHDRNLQGIIDAPEDRMIKIMIQKTEVAKTKLRKKL